MAKITNTEGAVKKNPLAKFAKSVGTQRLIALLALIIIYLVFGFINPAFRSYATLVNIFDASYYIGLMAIGVTFAITSDGAAFPLARHLVQREVQTRRRGV